MSAESTEESEPIDDIIPTRGYHMTPTFGLGASAGGLRALTDLLAAMPPDSGIVFVVVMHLAPGKASALGEILGRATSMKVMTAEDGHRAQPNHVYVIPPGHHIVAVNGHFRLIAIPEPRGKRDAIDVFFRSLADSHGPNAMAAVLSGADGDGALGLKRIKERGGLTIAQDPTEAEHPSMPREAIATGMVDWVLPVSAMPQRIIEYLQNARALVLPPEDGPPVLTTLDSPHSETTLRELLVYLRTRTGRDFGGYKRATILRRIARRMQVNGVHSLPAYVAYMRTHPGEAGALLQDLLISVTNFFRDADAFEAVTRLMPSLFEGRTHGHSLRFWVPACATGEEAYSLAILLLEYAQTLDAPPALQIFACDLNDEAIQAARAGQYADSIATDVSEERLKRFFVKERDGYRVRRELREMVLFATHDLLKDAPFSRMDLISCRNLLIYLDRDAQQRVLDTFHFALKPEGKLFLGSSEAVDEASSLFRALDKKHRIYTQQPVRAGIPVPLGPSTLLRTVHANEQLQAAAPVVHGKAFVVDSEVGFRTRLGRETDRLALAELHYKLLERYAPPSVLVDGQHDIIHLSEHAGQFLVFAGGEPTANLLRVAQPALRADLRAALFRAAETSAPVESIGIPIELEGAARTVTLRVVPAPDVAPGVMLVVFVLADLLLEQPMPERIAATPADGTVRFMERELEQVKGYLRTTIEQYEASTEELKASNEELQAMNEELRSATEELETSREELQSINEELSTVNQEMKVKMDELASANSDLQNLMASTSIATVFLDRALTIMRYTPRAVEIFNLIPGDVGRPLAHLKHRLEYGSLIQDAEQVLDTLVPIEKDVKGGNQSFLARLQPYRTLEDHIAGVVLTLVDVTERQRAIEAMRLSEERLRLLIESASDYAIFTTNPERRVATWNAGAESVFGYSENEILGELGDVLFTAEDRARGEPEREVRLASSEGRAKTERWQARKDGTVFYASGSTMPLRGHGDTIVGFVKIVRDLTDRQRTEEAMRDQMDDLTRFNRAAVGRETRMVELKAEINELATRLGESPRYPIAEDERS